MKTLILIAISVVFVGCSSLSRSNQISVGMTKQQVIDVLGQPSTTAASAGREALLYKNANSAWNGSPSSFCVKLESGVVSSYGAFPCAYVD